MWRGEKVHLYAVVYFFLIYLITFEHNKGDFSTPRFALRRTLYNIVYTLFIIFYHFFLYFLKKKIIKISVSFASSGVVVARIVWGGTLYCVRTVIFLHGHGRRARDWKLASGLLFPRGGRGLFLIFFNVYAIYSDR